VFTSQADRAALSGDYGQWLVDYLRSADVAGIEGGRDDWLAFAGDWGFDLDDARHVTLWHGDRDHRVTTANATWLATHIPDSTVHVLAGDGHLSIARHFQVIYRDLLAAR
jgi:hypothetical protein